MAAMTAAQKRKIRNWMERKAKEEGYDLDWLKGQIEAAGQAMIDELNTAPVKSAVSSAIDTATSPLVLTNPEKKKLGVIVYAILGEQDDA